MCLAPGEIKRVTLKKRSKKGLLILLVLAVSAGAGAWWRFGHRDESAKSAPATAAVVRRDLSSTVLATGAVKPQVGAEVKVGARISGRVEKLHVNVGDRVRRGDVLGELETDELAAQVALCTADLDEARARAMALRAERPKEIARAEATVADAGAVRRLAGLNWQRVSDLSQRGAATAHELDTARQELDTAEARLALVRAELALAKARMPDDIRIAEAQVASKQAKLREAKARLAYATIKASISGTVASVTTQQGETVAAGLNAPTFVTIIDLGRLQVDTFVDEVDIGNVKVGQEAVFTVDTFPDREFKGRVSAIYPKAVIQENVVNYDVVVEITGDYENLLRPEMTTNVTIFLETRPNVLTIPSRALQRQRGRNVVYVQTPDGPQTREVKVGRREGQWVQILDGLTEGQTVLLEPPASAGQSAMDL